MDSSPQIVSLSELILAYLENHRSLSGARRSLRPPKPKVIQEILSVLFYTSLRTEEGRSIQVHLFYMNPTHAGARPHLDSVISRGRFFKLEEHIPFTTDNLVKFAKAADSWTTGIAITHDRQNGLYIWGILDQVLHFGTEIVYEGLGTYIQPGVFHILVNGPADLTVMVYNDFIARLAQDRLIKFENKCLLHGNVSRKIRAWVGPAFESVMKDARKHSVPKDRPRWFPFIESGWTETICRILINIQRQRHGGAVLITPDSALPDLSIKYRLEYPRLMEGFRADVLQTISFYSARCRVERLQHSGNDSLPFELSKKVIEHEDAMEDSRKMLTGAIRCVASFAGVDGLVVMNPDLRVLGFGAIITTAEPVNDVIVSHSSAVDPRRRPTGHRFGTRHRSMIQYCFKHPKSLGFVVSQDGDIRVVTRIKHRCVVFDNVQVHNFENMFERDNDY